jgi:hypothetical protein
MRAVMLRDGTSIVIPVRACFFPYQKEKSLASMSPESGGDSGRGKIAGAAVIRIFR